MMFKVGKTKKTHNFKLYHVIHDVIHDVISFYTCYTGKSIDNHISHPHFVGGLARLVNHPVGSANSGPSGAHFISGFWIKIWAGFLCFTMLYYALLTLAVSEQFPFQSGLICPS